MPEATNPISAQAVLCVGDLKLQDIEALLARFDLSLVVVPDGEKIMASFWGCPEAGVVQQRVYVRADTPIHSLCHEMGHVICMPPERRSTLR